LTDNARGEIWPTTVRDLWSPPPPERINDPQIPLTRQYFGQEISFLGANSTSVGGQLGGYFFGALRAESMGALTRFLEDRELEIDNGATERTNRDIALDRGNWTFIAVTWRCWKASSLPVLSLTAIAKTKHQIARRCAT
jgi:hypothetical protein